MSSISFSPLNKTKRKPYTHLACDFCKEKHLKCDGRKPTCSNCLVKHMDCRYREERNRKRDAQFARQLKLEEDLRARLALMEQQIELWKVRFLHLRSWVKENQAPGYIPPYLLDPEEPSHTPPRAPSPLQSPHHSPHLSVRPRSYSLPDHPPPQEIHEPELPRFFHFKQFDSQPSIPSFNIEQSYEDNQEQQFQQQHGAYTTDRRYLIVDHPMGTDQHMVDEHGGYYVPPPEETTPSHRSRRSYSHEAPIHPLLSQHMTRRRTHSLGPGEGIPYNDGIIKVENEHGYHEVHPDHIISLDAPSEVYMNHEIHGHRQY